MLTIRQKIAYNATFSSIARIVNVLLALILTAYLTRYLGQAGFGNYIIVFTYWYIFIVLADLGLYQITVREISQNKEKESEIISNAFTLRLTATVLVFFIGILLLLFLPYSHELKIGLVLGALGFCAMSSSQVLVGIFQKNLKIDRISIAETLTRFVQFFLTLYVIEKDMGFLNVIAVLSASSVMNLAITCYFVNKLTKLRLVFNMSVWKKMVKEGWPLAVAAIFVMIYFRMNAIILSLIKGEDAVGVFGVGYKILENIIFFPTMFVGLVMPIMSLAAKNDLIKFKEVMEKTFNVFLIALVPMVAFTFLLSDKIVYTIGGKNFPQSAYVLDILIVATAMIFLATLWSNAIIALGSQRYLAKVYFWGAIISLIINIPLIYFFSYNGAAWGTLITESLVTIMMAIHLQKIISYIPSITRILRIFGAVIISSFVIVLIGNGIVLDSPITEMSIQLLLGSISYFIALLMLNGINTEEIGIFFNK